MLTKFFTGRINRKQYISYYAATIVVASLLIIGICVMTGLTDPAAIDNMGGDEIPSSIAIPANTVSLITLILGFSFDIRRFHDLDRPTSWAVVPLVLGGVNLLPIFDGMNLGTYILSGVQIAIFLYLCIAKGTQGDNEYGVEP